MLIRQRTQLSNAIRGHMAEYGLVASVGRNGLQRLITILDNPDDDRVPEMARVTGTVGYATRPVE
jgi:transposase